MRSITRRDLNHHSGQIIDEVLDTGEPIEVTTRGRQSVIITVRPRSVWEEWRAAGLVKLSSGRLSEAPTVTSASSVGEILDDISSDH